MAHMLLDQSFDDAKDELAGLALIDVQGSTLSIHRLVQRSFLHHMDLGQLQDVCNATASLLNSIFPKQIYGRPLVQQWAQCSKYGQHCLSLASYYKSLGTAYPLSADQDFIELLGNCAWYLFEIGDWGDCDKIIESAKTRCGDKTGLPYSHLLNTAGGSSFERNRLAAARVNLEESLRIRRKHLAPDDEDLLCTTNNLANLESAEGRTQEALKLFAQVRTAREKLGADAAISLALTYAGIARAYLANKSFDDSKDYFDRAMEIVVARYGPQGHFVAEYAIISYLSYKSLISEQAFTRSLGVWRSTGMTCRRPRDDFGLH